MISAAHVRSLLRSEANVRGSQRKLAREIGVSDPFLSDVIRGLREPSGKVLSWLHLRRVTLYERVT